MTKVAFDDTATPFLALPGWREDGEILAKARACIDAERGTAADLAALGYEPSERAKDEVSPEALERILASGNEVHGIATERDVTNAITFNAHHVADAVRSGRVARLRRALDRAVARKLRSVFTPAQRLLVYNSGHFWYPPGSYMGWHTNSLHPGWRLYLTHAEEPGRSFFRYRDPRSGEIVTCVDHEWDVRMFHIREDRPLWHAILSDTNRFSFGFLVRPFSLREQLGASARRVRRALSG